MAKKGASGRTYTYQDLASEVRAGRFAPVYLLQGEEPYYIDKLMELLSAKVVRDEEARDFDLHNFFGADADLRRVIDTARQFPLMGEHQLVCLREAQSMDRARAELEKLAAYVKNPVATTVLAIGFKAEPLKSTSELVKAIKGVGGVVFESQKAKEWQLGPIITQHCKEEGIQIDSKAVEMLKEYIGTDLARLFGEIDKLMVATNKAPVTPESIERNIGFSKDFNNFELVSAIATRDYPRAMRIADYFERNPKQNPVIMSTSILFRFFSNLMLAHYAPEKTERGLMAQLGFHSPYQLKEINVGIRNYNARSCMNIIHALRVLDCRSKGIGSAQKDYFLLKEFIYQAFTL